MLEISHIQCRVNNILEAVKDFQENGFEVELGKEEKKTQNALIWFEEGKYIELCQMPAICKWFSLPIGILYGKVAQNKWEKWCACTEGWCEFALENKTSIYEEKLNLKEIKIQLESKGIKTSKIIKGSRRKKDGEIVRFSYMPIDPPILPLIVTAYNPPQSPKVIAHQNGAKAIREIIIEVSHQDKFLFENLPIADNRIKLVDGDFTRISKIGIAGLERCLNKHKLHNAVIFKAD